MKAFFFPPSPISVMDVLSVANSHIGLPLLKQVPLTSSLGEGNDLLGKPLPDPKKLFPLALVLISTQHR